MFELSQYVLIRGPSQIDQPGQNKHVRQWETLHNSPGTHANYIISAESGIQPAEDTPRRGLLRHPASGAAQAGQQLPRYGRARRLCRLGHWFVFLREFEEDGRFLDEMDLSHNKFTEAPIAIGRLYKLKRLDLSSNRISKLYQFTFNKIPHLHTIDLSYNELQSVSLGNWKGDKPMFRSASTCSRTVAI